MYVIPMILMIAHIHHIPMLCSDIDWEQLQIPSPYLVKNWPLVHVALSGSGQQMAVAGKHGVVLYNRKIKRWRYSQ